MIQENPKKGKSKERYEAYKQATTMAEYYTRGGSKADARHDFTRGFLHFVDNTIAPPESRETQVTEDGDQTTSAGLSYTTKGLGT